MLPATAPTAPPPTHHAHPYEAVHQQHPTRAGDMRQRLPVLSRTCGSESACSTSPTTYPFRSISPTNETNCRTKIEKQLKGYIA